MRWTTFATALGLGLFCARAPNLRAGEPGPTFRFDKTELGKTPAGWKSTKTGRGEGSNWKVVADETAPSKRGLVLAQTAASPSSLFNLCVAAEGRFKDIEASVASKRCAARPTRAADSCGVIRTRTTTTWPA